MLEFPTANTGLLARFCCCSSGVGNRLVQAARSASNLLLTSGATLSSFALYRLIVAGPTEHASNSGRGVQGSTAVPPIAESITPTGTCSLSCKVTAKFHDSAKQFPTVSGAATIHFPCTS